MKTHKVLSWRQLPVRMPFTLTILCYLLLERTHAPGYVWGIVGTLLAIDWIASIVMMCTERRVTLSELSDPP